MPELPDITVYVERARERLLGRTLHRVRVPDPFVLRTALPPIAQAEGRIVQAVRTLGKRVVLALDGEHFLVIHLMIAGRLQWEEGGPTVGRVAGAGRHARSARARFEFDAGTLVLTEVGTTRRASLHLVQGAPALAALDPGGVDPLAVDAAGFARSLQIGNHTLKRALTDPRCFSGIGNAYSDEILHRARLSPLALARSLSPSQRQALFDATVAVLSEWIERLRAASPGWPAKVTAFRPGMAVHGRFGLPCPVCASPVQRIVRAHGESHYCARCQTGGRLLADRSLSRLLKSSRPKTLDEL